MTIYLGNLILINCFLKFSSLQTTKGLSFICGLLGNSVVILKKTGVPVAQIKYLETSLVLALFISMDENNIQWAKMPYWER